MIRRAVHAWLPTPRVVQVPLSEMFSYVSNLRSMTKGRGQYVMQLGDYKQVPPKIQEEIVASIKQAA